MNQISWGDNLGLFVMRELFLIILGAHCLKLPKVMVSMKPSPLTLGQFGPTKGDAECPGQ